MGCEREVQEQQAVCGQRREAPPGRDLRGTWGPEGQLRGRAGKASCTAGCGRTVSVNATARVLRGDSEGTVRD